LTHLVWRPWSKILGYARLLPVLKQSRLSRQRTIVFHAFDGAPPCDAPMAIARSIHRMDGDCFELVWAGNESVRPWANAPPFRFVDWGSREHYTVSARAAAIVTTHGYAPVVGPKTLVVQAWHGVPIKSLNRDNSNLDNRRLKKFYKFASRWDLLPSPSAFYDLRAVVAMGAQHAEFRCPLPRFDAVPESDRATVRAAVREALDLRDDEVFVLMAPTYRSDPVVTQPDGWKEEYARLAELLKLDSRVLFRDHYLGARAASPIDLQSFPDTLELLVASDLLVSDYSSLIADAIAIGLPFVCLVSDLESYRRDPGLNIDYPAELGPLLARTAGDASALATSLRSNTPLRMEAARIASALEGLFFGMDGGSYGGADRMAVEILKRVHRDRDDLEGCGFASRKQESSSG
jgi:CDP-glycerol glycerophosphotransferase